MKLSTNTLLCGIGMIFTFVLWTILVVTVDVRPEGVNQTNIGLSDLNTWFHSVTGVHMSLYTITDWAGLVPVFVCFVFGFVGLTQMIKRRSFKKVDSDIIFLGVYYVLVIACYLIFESVTINYRPVLIDGNMESSYPSSTTLLVLCVMPTLVFQSERRFIKTALKNIIKIFCMIFSVFMVVGRLVSGVHWLTDIVGSLFLSAGLFLIYKSVVLFLDEQEANRGIS